MIDSQISMMIKRLKKRCAQRLERIKQLERERDALLEGLERADRGCEYCKHCNSSVEPDADKCPCNKCRDNSHWEWAGIKEDDA